jgi:DNA-binding response OmpR family regulator
MHSVLIIDDDPEVGASLKRVLEISGYQARVAPGGGEGIAEFRRAPTDVIITDIIMPKKNGVDVIGEIRREFPKVPIIAISGGGNFGVAGFKPTAITTSAYLMASTTAGANAVLPKPFETRELLAAIRQVLETSP